MDLAFEPINPNLKMCGCYVVNSQLLNQHPKQRILLPLRSCDYQMEIINAVVNVTLTQTYFNPADKYLEVEYNFPISPNACVYRFVAQFGKNRMEGVVKEKEEAKKEYEKAVNEGKKAAYGEVNAESKDILNLKVGNIEPHQQVKIEIIYLQQLTLSFNTFYQLHLPATITPRYLNQIPNEQIKAGFRKTSSVITEGQFCWSFTISLKTTRKVSFFGSHTHNLKTISQNQNCTETIISLVQSCIPNKDFVFSYTTEDYQLPNYVFGRTDKSSTAMLSFIPKFCTLNVDDAYKASIQGKTLEGDIESAKGEYIFLLDRSGSMSGPRIEKAKEALILFIKSLPQDTYFNVVSFGSGSQFLFKESRRYGNDNISEAVQLIKGMSADMGGTEIFSPLNNLLAQKPKQGYPKQIFLLTDGGVSNTEGVLKMVGNNNKYARVHSIGIGNGASESLIIGCAKKGKGFHVFINDTQDPSEKIIQLLSDSLSAVITNINLQYDATVIQSIIPNPKSLPYYLKGEIINFYITFKGQLANKTNFIFTYQDSLNKLPFASKIQIDPQATSEPFIDKMGHYKRIKLLEESHSNNSSLEDFMYFVKKVDKKAQIISQSVEHQILSQFTAFICVEKELIDGKYQEVKQTGKVQVFIKSPPPNQDLYQFQSSLSSAQNYRMCSTTVGGSFYNSPENDRFKSLCSNSYYRPQKMAEMRSYDRPMKMGCALPKSSKRSENAMMKKSSSPGVLDKVAGFFKGFFSKEQKQQIIHQDKSINREVKEQKKQQESEIKCQNKKQQRPIAKKEKGKDNESLINLIVSEQDSEGYWKDISLIGKLFSKQVENIIQKQKNPFSVAAYLIAKWIQKHYPQKQYSLIAKKALGFARKEASNYESFPSLYDQYVQ